MHTHSLTWATYRSHVIWMSLPKKNPGRLGNELLRLGFRIYIIIIILIIYAFERKIRQIASIKISFFLSQRKKCTVPTIFVTSKRGEKIQVLKMVGMKSFCEREVKKALFSRTRWAWIRTFLDMREETALKAGDGKNCVRGEESEARMKWSCCSARFEY